MNYSTVRMSNSNLFLHVFRAPPARMNLDIVYAVCKRTLHICKYLVSALGLGTSLIFGNVFTYVIGIIVSRHIHHYNPIN